MAPIPTNDANQSPIEEKDGWVAEPRVPLSLPTHPVKRWVKVNVGLALSLIFKTRLASIHAKGLYAALGRLDQWMVAATAYRALQNGDDRLSSDILQKFWRSVEAATWMDGNSRYTEMFLPYHAAIVTPVVEAARSVDAEKLVEIGCGRGDVLRHFAEAIPELESLTGIDLNPALLNRAAQITHDPRVHFVVGDATALIDSLVKPGTVVLTNGGVYEYWSQDDLRAHFRRLALLPRVVVALVEPLGSDHNLDVETSSRPYGVEASLSHNYRYLLETFGFDISYSKEIFAGQQRWMMMVGLTNTHRQYRF